MKKLALGIVAIGLLAPGVVATIEAAAIDTVFVTPAKPTTRDSLHFRLRTTAHCCATVYRDTNVTVTDTVIMLRDTYDESPCATARCLVGWSEANFSCKPLAAKKYAIYKVETMYCPPPRLCPMLITMPVRVGTVTVSPPTGVLPIADRGAVATGTGLTVSGASLRATIPQSTRITISAYDLQGALLGNVYRGWMTAGSADFSLSPLFARVSARGTVLVRLTVGDGVSTAKTVWVSH